MLTLPPLPGPIHPHHHYPIPSSHCPIDLLPNLSASMCPISMWAFIILPIGIGRLQPVLPQSALWHFGTPCTGRAHVPPGHLLIKIGLLVLHFYRSASIFTLLVTTKRLRHTLKLEFALYSTPFNIFFLMHWMLMLQIAFGALPHGLLG